MNSLIFDFITDVLFFYMPGLVNTIRKMYMIYTGMPENWRRFLKHKVAFYQNLSPDEQIYFEKRIIEFLFDYRIKGIDYKPTDEDKLLVAAGAVIPVFRFNDWYYPNLKTVYLFADQFSINHPLIKKGTQLNGLVGAGKMKGKMYLSVKALHNSFDNERDKKNTAVHEFLHLIDMEDGRGDGVPETLLQRPYVIPWQNLIKTEIERICAGKSALNDYACTNATEFFAEAGVHFFENPVELKQHHPELYAMLQKIFKYK